MENYHYSHLTFIVFYNRKGKKYRLISFLYKFSIIIFKAYKTLKIEVYPEYIRLPYHPVDSL